MMPKDPAKIPGLNVSTLLGKKTLIQGEVKAGKTRLTSLIISRFLAQGQTGLVVMDLAPDLIQGIGGKMDIPADPGLRVYAPGIIAPRLTGGSPAEVETLAEENAKVIEAVFADYLRKPGSSLFINDVSLYLQAKEPQGLLALFTVTPTVVMNGYLGSRLGGGAFGKREKKRMQSLAGHCDLVLDLD